MSFLSPPLLRGGLVQPWFPFSSRQCIVEGRRFVSPFPFFSSNPRSPPPFLPFSGEIGSISRVFFFFFFFFLSSPSLQGFFPLPGRNRKTFFFPLLFLPVTSISPDPFTPGPTDPSPPPRDRLGFDKVLQRSWTNWVHSSFSEAPFQHFPFVPKQLVMWPSFFSPSTQQFAFH